MSKKMVNVSFRVEDEVKNNMQKICSNLGMSMASAFTIFMKKFVEEKGMPFEVKEKGHWDKDTLEAIKKSEDPNTIYIEYDPTDPKSKPLRVKLIDKGDHYERIVVDDKVRME